MIVRGHIGKVGVKVLVILEIDGYLLDAQQQGRFEPTVAARDEPAAVGDGDRRPPAFAFDHCCDGGNLGGSVGVGVFGMWLQVVRPDELIEGRNGFPSTTAGT